MCVCVCVRACMLACVHWCMCVHVWCVHVWCGVCERDLFGLLINSSSLFLKSGAYGV